MYLLPTRFGQSSELNQQITEYLDGRITTLPLCPRCSSESSYDEGLDFNDESRYRD